MTRNSQNYNRRVNTLKKNSLPNSERLRLVAVCGIRHNLQAVQPQITEYFGPVVLKHVSREAPRKIRSYALERLSGCLFGRGKIGIGQAFRGERAQQPRYVNHIVPAVTSSYYQTLRRIFH